MTMADMLDSERLFTEADEDALDDYRKARRAYWHQRRDYYDAEAIVDDEWEARLLEILTKRRAELAGTRHC